MARASRQATQRVNPCPPPFAATPKVAALSKEGGRGASAAVCVLGVRGEAESGRVP